MSTVAIVGMASPHKYYAPWHDEDIEIWCLNESYNFPSSQEGREFIPNLGDRDGYSFFQLHERWDWSRPGNHNDPYHATWLKNEPYTEKEIKELTEIRELRRENDPSLDPFTAKVGEPHRRDDLPIYMQQVFEDIPGSIKYPLDDVFALNENLLVRGEDAEPVRYFTSTMSYMLAQAVQCGRFDRIELYGVDAKSDTEWNYQKGAIEYWIGFANGRGIVVYLPEESTLCDGILYGYEGVRMLTEEWLLERKAKLEEFEQTYLTELRKLEKSRTEVMKSLSLSLPQEEMTRLNTESNELLTQMININSWANLYSGAKQEIQMYLKMLEGREEEGTGIIRQHIELRLSLIAETEEQAMAKVNAKAGDYQSYLRRLRAKKRKAEQDYLRAKVNKSFAEMVDLMGEANAYFGARQEAERCMAVLDMRPQPDELAKVVMPFDKTMK